RNTRQRTCASSKMGVARREIGWTETDRSVSFLSLVFPTARGRSPKGATAGRTGRSFWASTCSSNHGVPTKRSPPSVNGSKLWGENYGDRCDRFREADPTFARLGDVGRVCQGGRSPRL